MFYSGLILVSFVIRVQCKSQISIFVVKVKCVPHLVWSLCRQTLNAPSSLLNVYCITATNIYASLFNGHGISLPPPPPPPFVRPYECATDFTFISKLPTLRRTLAMLLVVAFMFTVTKNESPLVTNVWCNAFFFLVNSYRIVLVSVSFFFPCLHVPAWMCVNKRYIYIYFIRVEII